MSVPDGTRGEREPAIPRHLRRAPITEALIDFRVQLAEGFPVSKFDELAGHLKEYPTRSALRSVLAKVAVGTAGVRPDVQHSELGVIAKSVDERTQVQFRLNGFTLNRLEPYTSWAKIYPETMQLWRQYAELAKPIAVVRLAARYINRLKLPLPVSDLHDYLTTPPRVPQALPQTLRAYLTRVVIHDLSYDHSAIVTQSFEPNPVEPDRMTILLDIDAFKDVSLKPRQEKEIDQVLARLHNFKNEIFFNNITQKASELFE